ncbi:hypothetical protein ACLB2K_003593 [Fragaria x ananassa]
MADPWTSAAVGVLFAELYAGASKLIRDYIDFEPLLRDLERTLDALNSLIQNINAQNIAPYWNEVIENLKRDIVEGLKLVRKYSEAGAVAGCLKKPTTYTCQIRKLDLSLRRQLEILNAHQIWVMNDRLVTLMAEKKEVPTFRNDLVYNPIEVEDHSSVPLLMDNQNDAVPYEIKSNSSTVSGPVEVVQVAHSASVSNDDVFVPIQISSPLKIPKLRTVLPHRLRQPQNKKKRLEHKTHISSSDELTLLSPAGHNASAHHPQHMPSPNSTITIEFCQEHSSGEESVVDGQLRKHILPVDLERYGIEESSHLSGVGMQDMYLAMQRFHVMSTRLVQSEERIAALETNATNYQKAEESWKLEKRKLSEQCNFAMVQVASLTTEKDSLAEKIVLLEKNEVIARQEAHEILSKEWEPELRREMKEAEKYCFELGCRVGFKSFLAKVENKFPNLDLSDISQFEPIEFDMKLIEDLDRVGNRRQTISTVFGRASTRKYNVGDVGARYLVFFFKQLRSRERTTLLLSSFAGLDTI